MSSAITIRNYVETDFPSIHTLETALTLDNRENDYGGFITHTMDKFLEDVTTLVASYSNEIVGFITGGKGSSQSLEYLKSYWNKIKWNNTREELSDIIWIERISIDKRFQGQGVGSMLINEFLLRFDTSLILSAVVDKPIQNTQAQLFYERQGFKKIGTFSLPEYHGIKNYQSIIIKKIP